MGVRKLEKKLKRKSLTHSSSMRSTS